MKRAQLLGARHFQRRDLQPGRDQCFGFLTVCRQSPGRASRQGRLGIRLRQRRFFFGVQHHDLLAVGDDGGKVVTLQQTPRPIGLVFPCFGCRKAVFGFLHLGARAGFFGQL